MPTLPSLRTRFRQPVVDSGADPYVAAHGQYFYYCYVQHDVICIRRAEQLDDIGVSDQVAVWRSTGTGPESRNIWAPELHHLDGKWYIYFAAGPGPINEDKYHHHRMYVLEANDVLGPYHLKGQITDPTNLWAIDGTILEHPNGQRYYVWSGWDNPRGIDQQLYIARMANPWTLEGERVMISKPEYSWEKQGLAVNEGPQVLRQGNRIHIIYSASWSMTDDYCLGQLDLVGADPLDPAAWVKRPRPIFSRSKQLVGIGHACFLLSEDGQYGWMVFHAARYPGAAWDRQVRLAAFTWDKAGTLRFIRTDRTLPFAGAYQKLARILRFP
jgi:GH43 family beta-xylosidase